MLVRLLVPTDFSQASERTLSAAADLAASLDAELTVLHVGRATGHAARLSAFADRWGGGRVGTLIERRSSDPAQAILDASRDANLVVLAPRGVSGRASGLGSIAGTVARRAPVPVLLLSADAARLDRGRVVVLTDLGDAAAAALRLARTFAAALGGTVEVVHAVADAELATALGGEPASGEHDELRRRVERVVAEAGGADVPLTVRLAEGSPEDAVAEAASGKASAGAPALIVTGRSGDASSVDRLFAAGESMPMLHVPA